MLWSSCSVFKNWIEGINYNKQNPPPFECLNDNSFINVISKLNKNTIYKKKKKTSLHTLKTIVHD